MTVTVTGLEEALDALDVFKRSRIPGATAWGLDALGWMLRVNEAEYITRTFKSHVPFTVNAPMATKASKENPSITFFLRDQAAGGNDPASYLYPQVEGTEVYVTRFSRSLRRAKLIGEDEYVLHWGNPKYKPTGGRIQSILAALRKNVGPVRGGAKYSRNLRQVNEFFFRGLDKPKESVDIRKTPRKPEPGFKGPGIYTRKGGGQLELVYRVLREAPTVPAKYDWSERRIGAFAQEHLPKLILGKLAEL